MNRLIAIYNLEKKYINIALEKIKLYYQQQGDNVENYFALKHEQYDKIYVSSIFTFTDKKYVTKDMIYGGTGFSLMSQLPIEIENMKPKINVGFTTRGCIRKCWFCVVPQKEGDIRAVGDIYDFWDGKTKIIKILDNNILALPKHFIRICKQIKKENLSVDFNQGLDIRLLNKKNISLLKSIKHLEYKFAWDIEIKDMEKKLKLIKNEFGRCTIYVLAGINFDRELEKCNIIKFIGHNGYIQRLEKVRKIKKYITLARWVNQHHLFQTKIFDQFKNNEIYIKSNTGEFEGFIEKEGQQGIF